MRITRRVTAAAAAGAALALVAGCGGGSGGGSSEDSVELAVWMLTLEDTQKAALQTLVENFEAEHEGITVTVEERSTDSHKESLRQVAGTGVGPDVYFYWQGPGLGGELVDAGMSRDLTDFYEEYGWEEIFSDAALDGITQYGGYHGVPWTLQGEALYYNKTLFAEAGITSTPQTYDELVAAADALVAAGITPIQFGGTVNWHVMRLLDSLIETTCGAETADVLNTEQSGWDTEACVTEAFTELQTWGENYINDGFMGMSNDDSSELFYAGQAAMALEGTWFNGFVVDFGMNPDEVGIFPFPTETGRLYGFGEALYIAEDSEHPEEAAMFLDFISSTEQQEQVAGAFQAIPVNTAVAPSQDNPLHALWPPIFQAAEGMYINNDQNLSLDQTTEYWRIQNSVLTGRMTPAEAGPAFQAYIDAN